MTGIENLSEAIDQWMTDLSSRRPVFHSEFDFQFALCNVMARAGVTRIRLERMVQLPGSSRFEVDIMGSLHDLPIALELKYPKKRFVGTVSVDGYDEYFNLPSSGADDLDAQAIWQDAARIEKLMTAGIIEAGAVVALSNFEFWDQRKHTLKSQAYAFRLWQSREVQAGTMLSFPEPKRARSAVQLRCSYRCDWRPYSQPLASDFRYLVLAPVLRG